MFYKMITQKRNGWLNGRDCAIKNLIAYIEKTGAMRDAQIEAIKTYLFLKIKCGNKYVQRIERSGVLINYKEGITINVSRDKVQELKAVYLNYLRKTGAILFDDEEQN